RKKPRSEKHTVMQWISNRKAHEHLKFWSLLNPKLETLTSGRNQSQESRIPFKALNMTRSRLLRSVSRRWRKLLVRGIRLRIPERKQSNGPRVLRTMRALLQDSRRKWRALLFSYKSSPRLSKTGLLQIRSRQRFWQKTSKSVTAKYLQKQNQGSPR